MKYNFYIIGLLIECSLYGCNSNSVESKTNYKYNETIKDSITDKTSDNNDCLFDINGFNMAYLYKDSSFSTFRWDSINREAVGVFNDGIIMNCLVHACDTWGFNATFHWYNPTDIDTLPITLALDLFEKLPTTPDKEKYLSIIKINKDKIVVDTSQKYKRINLSILDECEFFIDLSREKDTTYIKFLMNSYY